MKLSRKLIPAMIMLLVSAVLMSTASFAWFSTNTTATATGMSVKIAAAKNLLIATVTEGKAGSYAASQELKVNETSMIPASTEKAVTPEFYYVTTAGDILPDNFAAANNTVFAKSADGTDGAEVAPKTVFVHKTVSIMATGEYEGKNTNHGDIVATVNAGGAGISSPVAPSLRVMLVVGGKAFLYAPYGSPSAYTPIKGTTSADLGTKIETFDNNSTKIVEGIAKDTGVTVEIYIWFEGQDAACTAANAITLDQISVSVAFGFASNNG